MHMMRDAHGTHVTVDEMYRGTRPAQVVQSYLAEILDLISVFDDFDVLAHIDYAVRYWPASAGPYRVDEFKEDYLRVLAVLAAKGKALEISTRVPLHADIVRWWHDLKGPAITFASDAHRPEQVAHGFPDAAAMAEAAGFAPTTDPHGLWTRH
jgi:histidinol-phosphatase (PHP family)